MSTLALTVLEFIDANWPTPAELRERFGVLLNVARDELLDVFGGWPYFITTTGIVEGGICYLCCDGWRNHLGGATDE